MGEVAEVNCVTQSLCPQYGKCSGGQFLGCDETHIYSNDNAQWPLSLFLPGLPTCVRSNDALHMIEVIRSAC